ncbi:MAG: glycosyl hydrolase family 8 [Chloroflexaceae bacterium]|nr:glycosyl hydrolase family 8 [Chloroflexaceae bacterium]
MVFDNPKAKSQKPKFPASLLAIALLLAQFGTLFWLNPRQADVTPMLRQSWEFYKANFISEGRVKDPFANNNTTSEGQSYALLRAVWLNDRATFDTVWAWTQANLLQENGLLAWNWGRKADGSSGVLDRNAASDADQDVALALLFAARRWNDPAYEAAALRMLPAIWRELTAEVAGQRVLVAGNWARGEGDGRAIINPSYFAPYAYRIFAQADAARPWLRLVDSSYALLEQISNDAALGGRLAPNWLAVDTRSGRLLPTDLFGDYARQFSYDALRLPWRIALDWYWFGDERARQALEALHVLPERYARDGRLVNNYATDGSPNSDDEGISMYGGAIGALALHPTLMQRMLREALMSRYHDEGYWGEPINYYDQNWAWFGVALAAGWLENVYGG